MTEFRPEKYWAKIEASAWRLKIARSFQEADRVPITISTAGSFYTRLFGGNIRDYYTDMDFQLEIQIEGLCWAFEELDDDRTGYGVYVDLGPVSEGIYFNLPIEYPDDTSPWIHHALSGPEAVESLEIPDPEGHPGVQRVYRLYEELKERVARLGLNLPVGGGFQIHPPLSCACALFPLNEIYTWMVEEPELIHRLFQKLLTAFCKLQDFRDKYFGTQTTSIGLADDNSAFISNAMYRKFVFPYNMAIYERYGQNGRYLHADGPNDHHFEMYSNEMKITDMDIGGFSDIKKAKPALYGKTFFSGGLNCKDLYYDLAHARPAIDFALSIGGPGGGYALAIGGETYPGVNPNTLIQAVAYAKQAGRYPIAISEEGCG